MILYQELVKDVTLYQGQGENEVLMCQGSLPLMT